MTVTDACVQLANVGEVIASLPQVLRSDAEENRHRILESARQLFSESGLDVTMRQIARRAEVGPATLYRRFPSKQDLVLEAFKSELAACRAIVREGVANTDPWQGFCSVVERITVLNVRNQGFTDAFLSVHASAADFASHRVDMLSEVATIIRRAQAVGALRQDFVVDDFVLILLAGRGLGRAPLEVRTVAAHRFAALAIDGLRASRSTGQLPPPARLSSAARDFSLDRV